MLHLERMDDVEAGGERRRAELGHSICQASDDVWKPIRCHYGLYRKDIEIRNQPRVCSLDATNDLAHLSGHPWRLNGQPLDGTTNTPQTALNKCIQHSPTYPVCICHARVWRVKANGLD